MDTQCQNLHTSGPVGLRRLKKLRHKIFYIIAVIFLCFVFTPPSGVKGY